MSKSSFWYGYLDAGDKSSAVLRDPKLDTGNKRTVFLFNLARNRILEYNREIVEPKLRQLDGGEKELVAALDGAYPAALRDFGAQHQLSSVPDSGPPPRRAAEKSNEDYDDADESDEDLDTESLDEGDEEEEF